MQIIAVVCFFTLLESLNLFPHQEFWPTIVWWVKKRQVQTHPMTRSDHHWSFQSWIQTLEWIGWELAPSSSKSIFVRSGFRMLIFKRIESFLLSRLSFLYLHQMSLNHSLWQFTKTFFCLAQGFLFFMGRSPFLIQLIKRSFLLFHPSILFHFLAGLKGSTPYWMFLDQFESV